MTKSEKAEYDRLRRVNLRVVLKEKRRAFYLENRERILSQMREGYKVNRKPLRRYYANRDAVLAQKKERRMANLDLFRKRDREIYVKNRDRELADAKSNRILNPELFRQRERRWYASNRSVILSKRRQRNSTVLGKLYVCARNTAKRAKDLGGNKPCRSLELLGAHPDIVRKHIESQFRPGMSWKNHGRRTWHLDHKKPLSSFDLTDESQFRQACHYTNLQPLWAYDNISKGAKI